MKHLIGRRRAKYWWIYASPASRLYERILGLDRVIVRSLTSTNFATFAFLPTGYVYDQTLIVFALPEWWHFGVLASRVHEGWALFFGGSMKDDPRYNVDSCFKPFPWPKRTADTPLETISSDCYSFRESMLVGNSEGLTKTYNRFQDPDETSSEIKILRDLHDEMDRAVLRGYGWDDLAEMATCEFLLNYEEEENDDPTAKKSNKKKPWRYRWPDEFRDDVLARLLELSEQRAMEEKLAGKAAEAKAKFSGSNKRGRKSSKKKEPGLFKE